MTPYMAVLLVAVAVPLAVSFWPPLKFWRNTSSLLKSIGLVLLFFGSWDVFATWRGHWHFNEQGVYSARIINLPIEEVLFFIVIPFCCIFTWETLKFIREQLR